MDSSHPHWGIITNDRRYRGVENLPRGESLEMCSVRVKAYWCVTMLRLDEEGSVNSAREVKD
jgi:hypothetical protein